MPTLCHPIIVVPGILASYLRNDYPLPPTYPWTVLTNDFPAIQLHPNDTRYEAREPARIVGDQVFEIAYKDLIHTLRRDLRPDNFESLSEAVKVAISDSGELPEVPVYPFGYDWRQPLELQVDRLADFIDEVIARTALMKEYRADGYTVDNGKVHLVGHSMGGLIIAGLIHKKLSGNAFDGQTIAQVGKVVTVATPFGGSFQAIVHMLTGQAMTEGYPAADRDASRLTPALYYLLPFAIWKDGDLTNVAAWQPSILASISEAVRVAGLTPLDQCERVAAELFAHLVRRGFAFQEKLRTLGQFGSQPWLDRNWLAILGVNAETRISMRKDGANNFILDQHAVQNRFGAAKTWEEAQLTGDSTVPYLGALPPFLGRDKLVLVTPQDFGNWEWRDSLLTARIGFHGMIPNMNMVQRLLVRFFKDSRTKFNNTWGRQAPGISITDWNPPLQLRHADRPS